MTDDTHDDAGRHEAPQCMGLLVHFTSGRSKEYPIHSGGSWYYVTDDTLPRIVVKPDDRGVPRHEIPLHNVESVMIARRDDTHLAHRHRPPRSAMQTEVEVR